MKKKILASFLALTIVVSASVSVHAINLPWDWGMTGGWQSGGGGPSSGSGSGMHPPYGTLNGICEN